MASLRIPALRALRSPTTQECRWVLRVPQGHSFCHEQSQRFGLAQLLKKSIQGSKHPYNQVRKAVVCSHSETVPEIPPPAVATHSVFQSCHLCRAFDDLITARLILDNFLLRLIDSDRPTI